MLLSLSYPLSLTPACHVSPFSYIPPLSSLLSLYIILLFPVSPSHDTWGTPASTRPLLYHSCVTEIRPPRPPLPDSSLKFRSFFSFSTVAAAVAAPLSLSLHPACCLCFFFSCLLTFLRVTPFLYIMSVFLDVDVVESSNNAVSSSIGRRLPPPVYKRPQSMNHAAGEERLERGNGRVDWQAAKGLIAGQAPLLRGIMQGKNPLTLQWGLGLKENEKGWKQETIRGERRGEAERKAGNEGV